MSQINKQIIADTMFITDLPIDQLKGTYESDDAPCCVGARLAGYFEIESGNYMLGIDEFAKRLGGNRAHVILILREAGAGHDPLSADEWSNTPKDVWRNLLKIEKLPSLSGADLRYENLRGANLSGTNLSSANLSCADLTNANLRGTNLSYTNLSGANLSDANLNGAVLYKADLTDANLKNVDLDKSVSL